MRTDFSPVRYFNPLAVASAVQGGLGAIQGIIGMARQSKALRDLENLQTPTYTASKSILDYYNQALQRYNVDLYSSALYKTSQHDARRGLAAALKYNRSSGGTANILQSYNDSMRRAGVSAEDEKSRRFGQLGAAAGMETGERMKEFEFNKLAPYQKQLQLLGLKASGGGQLLNAGLSNVFGSTQSLSQMGMLNQMYGGGSGGGGSAGGGGSMIDWDSPRYRNRIGG